MPDAQLAHLHNPSITNATEADKLEINRFLSQNHLTHRHLDWYSPVEWIGQKPYLVEKSKGQISSILLAANEVAETAWIRLFSTQKIDCLEYTWNELLSQALLILKSNGINKIAALKSSDWFGALLDQSDFYPLVDIVVLQIKQFSSSKSRANSTITIRTMTPDDLAEVHFIDQSAFDPLWQNALASLTKAFQLQGLSTVAIKNGKIVGYQISTWLGNHGHLARLAVRPEYQGQQIASALVADLLNRFDRLNIWEVTVNTQADNIASLTVYDKFGFQHTGEVISVYQRDL